MSAKFSIGIDLGTTHSALAYLALSVDDAAVKVLEIPQVLHADEVGECSQLPSFLYIPVMGEFSKDAFDLPFANEGSRAVLGENSVMHCTGVFARDRGAEVPRRVVSSAKSWLSHPHVNRKGPILPFAGADDIQKVSPVAVSAAYLRHLLLAWEYVFPDAPFKEQQVILTVPASFDAVAKELTQEAAALAGFGEFSLLEEPQAALYAWLSQDLYDENKSEESSWRKQVSAGDELLVVDVGGGTCDFSLIEVVDENGNLELSRKAVGEHILLGGDNMDAALAMTLKAELEADKKSISDWQLRAMVHGCRKAKEQLLDDKNTEKSIRIVVPGRGKSLLGKSMRVELSLEKVEQVVLDGFFPKTNFDDKPAHFKRGLATMGLPFAQDAAVTKHLAAFLQKHKMQEKAASNDDKSKASLGSGQIPNKILFNGGVTRSQKIQDKILETLAAWAKEANAPTPVLLQGGDVELAVAKGAAYYGSVRLGNGVRIKGGTARAYYVGIERAGLAIPGLAPTVEAVCVAPMGLEEDNEVLLPMELGLFVGEPVSFRFFSSTERRDDKIGHVCRLDEVEEIAPIETVLEGDAGAMVPGRLSVRVTSIGTLDLQVQDTTSKQKWQFSFSVRVH